MKRLLQAYQCSDPQNARRQLREWYRQPLGEAFLQCEKKLVGQLLQGAFGYHMAQLGAPAGDVLINESRFSHRLIVSQNLPDTACSPQTGLIQASPDTLPLASDSMDLLLLPHLLEFEHDPHQVLREVERVLIPEGRVAILGFNPWGWFGARRLLQGWQDEAPWSGHFYTPLRLKDWLRLLGFDTELLHHYYHRPPINYRSSPQSNHRMEQWGQKFWPLLSGGYMLVAKKRVATITPIKPRWRVARGLINVGLTEARRNKT